MQEQLEYMFTENHSSSTSKQACCTYLSRKKKQCHRPLSDVAFCLLHRQTTGNRVVCTRCKSSILANKFTRHLRVCTEPAESAYFHRNINTIINHPCNSQSISTQESEIGLMHKIQTAYALHVGLITYSSSRRYDNGIESSGGKSYLKHKLQESSIVWNMQQFNIVPSPTKNSSNFPIFVDVGAGAGALTNHLKSIVPDSIYLCVERATYKHKKENGIQGASRICVDIEHFNLRAAADDAFAAFQSRKASFTAEADSSPKSTSQELYMVSEDKREDGYEIICMGKHLCGNAIDFSILSCHNAVKQEKVGCCECPVIVPHC